MSATPKLTALVTGAAREGGIGRAIVARLEADGMDVVTLDVRPGCTYQVDLVDDELPDLADIDVLVCNAALATMFGAAHTFKLERWQRDLDVNLTGTLRTVQACLPGMRERGFGRIVVISSTAATRGMPAQLSYSTAKAGLLGFMRTIAAENADRGITANAVLPGMTASSEMLSVAPEILDGWRASLPMGELVRTEDIADAVAFFASPSASSVTGQELTVDGGDGLNTRSVTSSVIRGRETAIAPRG
jgi:NAD(P)-dependent dehydrogenase (short-subunit alcohol dehydrogenase family)